MEFMFVPAEEKVLIDRRPQNAENGNRMAKDERFSFQLAIYSDKSHMVDLSLSSSITKWITVRQVDYVPCTSPHTVERDDYYINEEPFLCPDVLTPLVYPERPITLRHGWNAIWFTVQGKLRAGRHKIGVTLREKDTVLFDGTYTLEVLNFALGKPTVTYTNWFHYDGLSHYYRVPVFSKAYNKIMFSFIEDAVAHGMNMLLIPMFTPPLDTAVGTYRKTVQLVDVTETESGYSFGFDRLIWFIREVAKRGIRYFELSHLFSQWGAKCAPQIVATGKDGKTKRIFGWDTPAVTGAYPAFLRAFLPALRERLVAEGLYQNCRFHLSDEPTPEWFDQYKAAHDLFFSILPDAVTMDALSHYDFYEQGLVNVAIPSVNSLRPFVDHKVKELWTYYCCGPANEYYTNRYMAQPGERTRVLGIQLWRNGIHGFLQWGYNFYNTVISLRPVNPYLVTDGGGEFPSGDAFIVYPGEDGKPVDSLRHELFAGALQDYALLERAADKAGRDTVDRMLQDAGYDLDLRVYPHNVAALKEVRRRAQDMAK